MDWRQSEILALIRLYNQEVCLWDCHDIDYKNQPLRNKAWRRLSKYLKKDIDEIKKKMKNLRNSYLAEKKKVIKFANKQLPYETHLYYYKHMAFLDPVQYARVVPGQVGRDDPLIDDTTSNTFLKQTVTYEVPKIERFDYSEDDRIEPKAEEEVEEVLEDEMEEETITFSRRSSFNESQRSTLHTELKSIQRLTPRNNSVSNMQSQKNYQIAKRPAQSKEETFCSMICSELKLLKSEETYDNVTLEIFVALRNAKAADRKESCNNM